MTQNQIRYAELQETKRHNIVYETETNRHNVETESIGWHTAESQRISANAAMVGAYAAQAQAAAAQSQAAAAHRQAAAAEMNAATNDYLKESKAYNLKQSADAAVINATVGSIANIAKAFMTRG